MVCFDLVDEARYFGPDAEAELILGDLRNRFRRDVLDAYEPSLLFLDFHAHDLLREAILETLAHPRGRVLAIQTVPTGSAIPR